MQELLRLEKSSPNVRLDWTLFPAGGNRYVVRRKQVVDPNDKTFDGSAVIVAIDDPTRTHDDPVLNDGNRYDYRVFRQVLTESLYFYHSDQLGTPIAMSGSTATLVWRAEHLPFGGISSLPVSSVVNNLRLPGQYFDGEHGLHQNWFRTYSPAIGRYLEPDPIAWVAEFHLYPFVAGNPTRWTDPLGLFRNGDVVYREDPQYPGSGDVTFIWDDPTPDQDGNGDEFILAFGNTRT